MKSWTNRAAASVAALLLAAGCGSDGANLTLSTRLVAPQAAAGALQIGERVVLQRVRMAIRDVKLEKHTAGTEIEIETGPFLLDLEGPELDGGVVQQLAVEVPADTYDELRFVVHRLEDGQSVGDPILDSRQASIVLDLLVDGEATTWQTDVNDEQRLSGVFVVSGQGMDNVTIRIDPAGWFTGAGGAFLDPRLEASRQAIEDNVRSSIDAFEDDDRDGHDDGPGHT